MKRGLLALIIAAGIVVCAPNERPSSIEAKQKTCTRTNFEDRQIYTPQNRVPSSLEYDASKPSESRIKVYY